MALTSRSFWQKGVQAYFLGCKGGRCLVLKPLARSCAYFIKIWEPQPPETLWAVLTVRISALFIASETAPEDVTFKVVMLGAVSWDCQKEMCNVTGSIRDSSSPTLRNKYCRRVWTNGATYLYVKRDKGGVTYSGPWDCYNKSAQDFSTSESGNWFFISSLQTG